MNSSEPEGVANASDVARLFVRANEVFGGSTIANNWLRRSQSIINGRTPLHMATSAGGFETVEQALGRIEHGVFS